MKKTRAFLKWAGGKYSLVEEIAERLPAGRVLLEPFVGAGSVFLNTDYDAYVLNDINPDLIGLYNHLKRQPDNFIREARKATVEDVKKELAQMGMTIETLKANPAAIDNVEEFKKTMDTFSAPNPFMVGDAKLTYVGTSSFGQKRQVSVPLVVNEFKDGAFQTLFVAQVD